MPSVADNLNAAIAGYAAALAEDAANPKPTYTLDNKTVSQNEWRAGIQRIIDALQKTVNGQTPYIVSTRMVL